MKVWLQALHVDIELRKESNDANVIVHRVKHWQQWALVLEIFEEYF
jgi:hypothetical protein